MFKRRDAQGLPITVIIVAVIGLIVLVVIIAILTGKLGAFSSGVESVASCENTCNAIGAKFLSGGATDREACEANPNRRYMPGTYSDVPGKACCCLRQ